MSRARNHRRRLSAAVSIAAILPLSLAACGSFGGGDDSAEGSSDGTITFWQYYGDEKMPTGAPLYDVLEKYDSRSDDVEIDIRYIPFEDFNRTLTQAAASGELPDVALINAFDTQNMAEAEIISDLSDRVEKWGEQDAYFPTSWETTQVDGATYGIPHVADAYAVYYNKDLLKAANLNPPTTWSEMEQTAAELGREGKYGLAVSGIEGAQGATGVVLRTLAAGGTIEDFGDGGGATALESFKTLVDDGGMSKGFLTWTEEDAKNQFANGEAAMMINSATYVSILRDENPELNWGVALLPKDKTRETFLSAENLTIGEGSDDADAAWDLITYLQKPDVLADYLPARNKLPARDDVPGTDEDPVRKVFAEQLQDAWAPQGALATHADEALTIVQEALQAAISGSADPADAAGTAQSDIDEALSAS